MRIKKLVTILSFIMLTHFILLNTILVGANANIQGSNNGDDDYLWAYDHFKAAISPESGLVEDIDKDGNNEVLVGTHDNGLFLLSELGEVIWNYDEVDEAIYNIFCYNILGDDKLEIIFSTSYNYLTVLDTEGKVVWQVQVSPSDSDQNMAHKLLFEDVNNDTIIDIIYGDRIGGITVLTNNGSIIWRENADSWTGKFGSHEMAIGEYNSKKVILASSWDGNTRMVNVETGTQIEAWNTLSYNNCPELESQSSVKLIDINADSVPETILYISLNEDYPKYWVIDGLSRSILLSGVYDQPIFEMNAIKNYNTNTYRIIIVGGSGHVTCKNLDDSISWHKYDGHADFVSIAADINGDNIEDLVISIGQSMKAFSGVDGYLFWVNTDWVSHSRSICIGDINNDGSPDVLASLGSGFTGQLVAINGESGSTFWIFTNDTIFRPIWDVAYLETEVEDYVIVARGNDNQFSGPVEGIVTCLNGLNGQIIWENLDLAGARNLLIVPDVNGDDIDEIFVTALTYHSYLLDGSNGNIIWEKIVSGYISRELQLFDINNDGIKEIVILSGETLHFIDTLTKDNIKTKYFDDIGFYTIFEKEDGDYNIIVSSFGMIEAYDRYDNIIWNSSTTGCAYSLEIFEDQEILIAGESVIFAELDYQVLKPQIYSIDLNTGELFWNTSAMGRYGVDEIIIADVNYDGSPEIFTRNTDSVDILSMNGSIIWSRAFYNIDFIRIGEFNGDNRLDLAVLTTYSGLEIYDANTRDFVYEIYDTPVASTSILVADLNKDNLDDVVIGTYGGSVETSTEYSVIAYLGKKVDTGLPVIENPYDNSNTNSNFEFTSFSGLNTLLIALVIIGSMKVFKKRI